MTSTVDDSSSGATGLATPSPFRSAITMESGDPAQWPDIRTKAPSPRPRRAEPLPRLPPRPAVATAMRAFGDRL